MLVWDGLRPWSHLFWATRLLGCPQVLLALPTGFDSGSGYWPIGLPDGSANCTRRHPNLVRQSASTVGSPGRDLEWLGLVTDVWYKHVWDFQRKSGSSGSCRLSLHLLGKFALQKMSGKTPGSPRHPSSRHPWPSDRFSQVLFKPYSETR